MFGLNAEEMSSMACSGSSSNGLVTVTINGLGLMVAADIDESLLVAENKKLLSDYIVQANNDAVAKVDAVIQKTMTDNINKAVDKYYRSSVAVEDDKLSDLSFDDPASIFGSGFKGGRGNN
jgi:DNA-binding YbaB/EbfC family protein